MHAASDGLILTLNTDVVCRTILRLATHLGMSLVSCTVPYSAGCDQVGALCMDDSQ